MGSTTLKILNLNTNNVTDLTAIINTTFNTNSKLIDYIEGY